MILQMAAAWMEFAAPSDALGHQSYSGSGCPPRPAPASGWRGCLSRCLGAGSPGAGCRCPGRSAASVLGLDRRSGASYWSSTDLGGRCRFCRVTPLFWRPIDLHRRELEVLAGVAGLVEGQRRRVGVDVSARRVDQVQIRERAEPAGEPPSSPTARRRSTGSTPRPCRQSPAPCTEVRAGLAT